MILSHGQSFIERGFSINKEISDNNLQEKSLISQRFIYEHFTSENVVLHEYVIPQEDSIKETVEMEKSKKRKLKLEEIAIVKKSKLAVQETIGFLNRALKRTLQKLNRKEISHYYQKLMLSEFR